MTYYLHTARKMLNQSQSQWWLHFVHIKMNKNKTEWEIVDTYNQERNTWPSIYKVFTLFVVVVAINLKPFPVGIRTA